MQDKIRIPVSRFRLALVRAVQVFPLPLILMYVMTVYEENAEFFWSAGS